MRHETKEPSVLGIDPGLANTGYAVVLRSRNQTFTITASGCIRTEPPATEPARLLHIYEQIGELIDAHVPNLVAIERVFHNKNISSSLSTAAVIGAIEMRAEQEGRKTQRFTPQQVKTAVCGHSRIKKTAVQKFVEKLTGVSVQNAHTADAIACAIAGHLALRRPPTR